MGLDGTDDPEGSVPGNGLIPDSDSPFHLVIGVGNPDREGALLPGLGRSGSFLIVARCLVADELLDALNQGQADVALVGLGLHRLESEVLDALGRTGVPLVILASEREVGRWETLPGLVLPADADIETVRQALLLAARNERPVPAPEIRAVETPIAPMPSSPPPLVGDTLSPIAVVGGYGSPGATTVALNLAAALGAVARTVLVDLSGPGMAGFLDFDPTRHLAMLARAEPDGAGDWERALAQETQPLSSRSPYSALLAGVPKPEMWAGISARFLAHLVEELQRRYEYVILDVGAGAHETPMYRAALGPSRQLLLVAGPDLVALRQAQTALAQLERGLQVSRDRTALVLNRYDRRHHHGPTEISWALKLPLAAVIPYDYRAGQRALASQQPLVLAQRSPAARALLDLAARVYGDRVALPSEAKPPVRFRWRHWIPRRRGSVPRPAPSQSDGGRPASVG